MRDYYLELVSILKTKCLLTFSGKVVFAIGLT